MGSSEIVDVKVLSYLQIYSQVRPFSYPSLPHFLDEDEPTETSFSAPCFWVLGETEAETVALGATVGGSLEEGVLLREQNQCSPGRSRDSARPARS